MSSTVTVSVRDARSSEGDRAWIESVYRDYLDDRRFPPHQGAGVLVIQAPDERQLLALLGRVNRKVFGLDPERIALPLEGRKLHVQTDWGRDED